MTWLETCTKQRWEIDSPETYPYTTAEIAHALSQLCRYAGHTPHLYSVAQHSLAVYAALAETEHARDRRLMLVALLHDASEAFLVDIPAPIKRLPGMESYRELERRVQLAILSALLPGPKPGEGWVDHPVIRHADLAVLHREKISVLGSTLEWGDLPPPAPESIWTQPEPIDPVFVERAFRIHLDQVREECMRGAR
jgi:uncharacterized protein